MNGKPTEDQPKSLADILAEELDGCASDSCTQNEPAETKQAKLREVYARIHALEPKRSALCLSGGGIRSASFGLGILQGLARRGLLEQFDYLSTVSGGGYVGGWLTAWIKNHKEHREGVIKELKNRPEKTLLPEPEPIRHLRAYNNYLTPKLGFFSADTWTLIATFLRNMLLNWLILISWLAAAMMVPRFCLAAVPLQPGDVMLKILLGLGTALIASAMAYTVLDLPCSGNANWSQRRFILLRQLPLFLAALCLAEWWSGFCTLHGEDQAAFLKTPDGVWSFAGYLAFAYFAGGLFVDIGSGFIKKTPRKFEALPWIARLLGVAVSTALGGIALWAMAAWVFPDPAGDARRYTCFSPPLIMGVFVLVNFLFAGLASRVSADEDREWWGRSAAWLIITATTWTASAGLVIFGPFLFTYEGPLLKAVLGATGGVTGLITAAFGFSSRSAAKESSQSSFLQQLLPVLAAIVFFLFLSLGISRVLDGTTALSFRVGEIYAVRIYSNDPKASKTSEAGELHQTNAHSFDVPKWTQAYRKQVVEDLLFTMGMLAAGIAFGFFINVNKFSLHAVYRSRLIRAFLGASRPRDKRKPHRFTGFDPEDDVKMRDLEKEKPLHLVNIALNLVRGEELAWQERKAESFTVSRLHSGCWRTGYRSSEAYGDGISLGTALAISGAAASPNMGYNSSPVVGFLMTLFNLRLGWWLGNPAGAAWEKTGPIYAVGPLFSEASGNTTDKYKYVNLSDGGHFENLGLYEMVLRRCRFIVAIDAGCDKDYVFEDLGNALRKIRIDCGVQIDLKVSSPKLAKGQIHHCAFGRIRYSEVDGEGTDGCLVYIKPVLSGEESADIANYAAAHPEFPHESTADQWFSESQFESYRALGEHSIESICGVDWDSKTLSEFFKSAQLSSDPPEICRSAEMQKAGKAEAAGDQV